MTIEMPHEPDAAAFAMEVTTVSVAQMLRRMLTQDDHTGLRREALEAARELTGATAAWWVGPLGEGWGVLAATGTGTASKTLRCLTVEPRLGRSVKTDLPEAFVLNGAEIEGFPTWEAELFAAGHRTCLTAPIRLAGTIVGEAILGFPKVTRWSTLLENSILMLFNTAAIADARLSELESVRRAQDGYAHEGVRLLRSLDAPLQLARKLAGGRTLDDALLDAMRIIGCRLEVKATEQPVGLGQIEVPIPGAPGRFLRASEASDIPRSIIELLALVIGMSGSVGVLRQLGAPAAGMDDAEAHRLLGGLLDVPGRTGVELRTTLRVFLENERRAKPTAEALHVHPNTLRYRMDRINQLINANLDHPKDRLGVLILLTYMNTDLP